MQQRLPAIFLILLLSSLPLGGLVGIHAWQLQTLLDAGRATPREVTLADLETNGWRDNVHVTLTGFTFGQGYVIQKETNREEWKSVWVPVFRDGQAESRDDFKVVVRSLAIPDEARLQEFSKKTRVTGVITNPIHQFNTGHLRYLRERYPNSDVSNLIVIEDGKPFPTPNEVWFYWILAIAGISGGVLSAAGLVLTLLRNRRSSAVPNVVEGE